MIAEEIEQVASCHREALRNLSSQRAGARKRLWVELDKHQVRPRVSLGTRENLFLLSLEIEQEQAKAPFGQGPEHLRRA